MGCARERYVAWTEAAVAITLEAGDTEALHVAAVAHAIVLCDDEGKF